MTPPRCIVVMGVSGSGKTTVAEALAAKLGYEFLEGDALHPARNIEAMRAGIPLNDVMRGPWLDRIAGHIAGASGLGIVATCSALKRSYRSRLAVADELFFLHLELDAAECHRRVSGRLGHFMPPDLVDSQLRALEQLGPDEPGVTIDATLPLAEIVERCVAFLPD